MTKQKVLLKAIVLCLVSWAVFGQKLHEMCDLWAYDEAQCAINYKFMWTFCRDSCLDLAMSGIYSTPPIRDGERPINDEQCQAWANEGECTQNLGFLQTHCPKECGYGLAWNIFIRNTLEMESLPESEGAAMEPEQQPVAWKSTDYERFNNHVRYRDLQESLARDRMNKRKYIRDYMASLSHKADKTKKGGNKRKKFSEIEKVVQAIDMKMLEVQPNSMAQPVTGGEEEEDQTSAVSVPGIDLLDVGADLADRLSMYVEQGMVYNVTAHGFNLDAPQPLHGIYGLYEAALYSTRIFQLCIYLLTEGLEQQQQQQQQQERDDDFVNKRLELHRSLLSASEKFVSLEGNIELTLHHARYDFDPIARHTYDIVRTLRENRKVIDDVLLEGEETGALVTYTPSGSLLDVKEAHRAMVGVFRASGKNPVPTGGVEAQHSPVTADPPIIQDGGTVRLNTGIVMPVLAFGTWKLQQVDCETAVLRAIEAGYRHIDSAQAYANERYTGNAIREALKTIPGLQRKDLFVATKLSDEGSSGGFLQTRALIEQQMEHLSVEYLDLYYLHSPFQDKQRLEGSLTAIFELILEGKIRCFGLSNFDAGSLAAFYTPGGPFVRAVNLMATVQDVDKTRLEYLRPVVLQNKLDLYHVGRQFDNVGTATVMATAKTYKLFLMGYSPFSGYPFALMPTRDPVVKAVTNEYNEKLHGNRSVGNLNNEEATVTKLDAAAVLVKHHLQHDQAGTILRSVSLPHLQTCLAAVTNTDQFPLLSATHEELLSMIQELVCNPYLKSAHYASTQ